MGAEVDRFGGELCRIFAVTGAQVLISGTACYLAIRHLNARWAAVSMVAAGALQGVGLVSMLYVPRTRYSQLQGLELDAPTGIDDMPTVKDARDFLEQWATPSAMALGKLRSLVDWDCGLLLLIQPLWVVAVTGLGRWTGDGVIRRGSAVVLGLYSGSVVMWPSLIAVALKADSAVSGSEFEGFEVRYMEIRGALEALCGKSLD